MTRFSIERVAFEHEAVRVWGDLDRRHSNWPVVYVLDNDREVYVGESLNAAARIRQHLESPSKQALHAVRVVLDERFNKSVCLDLESSLIRWFGGDGKYTVLNRNDGITDAEYYDRAAYQRMFDEIFDEMRAEGLFTRSIPAIENSDLFKLSPFKALNEQQAVAVEHLLEGLVSDIGSGSDSVSVVRGEPGTGKTIVAIYLMKLLRDIATRTDLDDLDRDSMFSDFFLGEYRELLADLRVAMVIPQGSLRKSVQQVFAKTPGLTKHMALSPWDVAKLTIKQAASGEGAPRKLFDVLVVDETHRLSRRANQSSGVLNGDFARINIALFGRDSLEFTQLDWLQACSRHLVLMLDTDQRVRPMDLSRETLHAVMREAERDGRLFPLESQMRVLAGGDYIEYIRGVLSDSPPSPRVFDDYDLRFFDDFSEMVTDLRTRDEEDGLARLTAGYAWRWRSQRDPAAFDIEIDGVQLRWNTTTTDWIASTASKHEVGSIHTLQGYDLNYAGVIIGPDLRFDAQQQRIVFDRSNYFDAKGMENNKQLGIVWSDDDLLDFVRNIYAVLLTRGMRGTYVYVCDPALREHLRPFFTA